MSVIKKSKKLSNDTMDALTIVVVIAVIVSGVCFWLASMPS